MRIPCIHLFLKSSRRLFLSICGCSAILLLVFYIYGAKLPDKSLPEFVGGRTKLRPEIFRNASRTLRPEVCRRRDLHSNATSIIFVLSKPQNARRRQVIRSGWGQKKVSAFLGTGVLFVVGESQELHTQISLEAEIFNDIIHTDFASYKAAEALDIVTALRWIGENCRRVRFIVKVNDDVVLSPFGLKRYLDYIHSIQYENSERKPDRDLANVASNVKFKGDDSPSSESVHRSNEDSSVFQKNPGAADQGIRQTIDRYEVSRDLKFADSHAETNAERPPVHVDRPIRGMEFLSAGGGAGLHQKTIAATKFPEKTTISSSLHCLVLCNVTVVRSWKTQWSEKQKLDYSSNPSYCSPNGYIIPAALSGMLINAYETDYSDDIHRWAPDFYVTGLLAGHAGIQHRDIRYKYAFDIGEIDDETVFIPLGSNVEAISTSVWKLIIEREAEMGNVNMIA